MGGLVRLFTRLPVLRPGPRDRCGPGRRAPEAAVLACCLAVVAGLAQRLPVVAVPEEVLVAPVRHLVVNDRRRDSSAGGLVLSTQRVLLQPARACALPSGGVATLMGRAAPLILLAPFDLTVCVAPASAVADQQPAPWEGAGSRHCVRHRAEEERPGRAWPSQATKPGGDNCNGSKKPAVVAEGGPCCGGVNYVRLLSMSARCERFSASRRAVRSRSSCFL